MGGAATKEFQTQRLNISEMQEIEQKLKEMVDLGIQKNLLPRKMKWGIPLSFSEKDSFGDVDFLSTVPQNEISNWLKEMENLGFVQIKGVVRNGTMRHYALSLDDNKFFQMDTLHAPSLKQFEPYYYYLSYNILGNLIGKIAAYHNLYFGFNGLSKALYSDKNGNLHEVQRMKSKQDVEPNGFTEKTVIHLKYKTGTFWDNLEFLGFDPDRYRKGFNSLQDIFNYVVESKYFCHEAFILDNVNSKAASRDRKSDNYQLFLNFIDNIPVKQGQGQLSLRDLYKYFPHLPQQVRGLSKKYRSTVQNKGKFNALAIKSEMTRHGVIFDNTESPYIHQENLIVPNQYLSQIMPKVKDFMDKRSNHEHISNLSRKQIMLEMSPMLKEFSEKWKTSLKQQNSLSNQFKP